MPTNKDAKWQYLYEMWCIMLDLDKLFKNTDYNRMTRYRNIYKETDKLSDDIYSLYVHHRHTNVRYNKN